MWLRFDESEKLFSCLRIIPKFAEHRTRRRATLGLLNPPHDHAQVSADKQQHNTQTPLEQLGDEQPRGGAEAPTILVGIGRGIFAKPLRNASEGEGR